MKPAFIWITAIVLLLLYFLLPFFVLGHTSITGFTLSGGNNNILALGKDKAYDVARAPWMYLLLVLPICSLVLSSIPKTKRFSNIAGAAASVVGIVLLIAVFSEFNTVACTIRDGNNYSLGKLSAGAGLYLSILTNIVVLIAAIYNMIAAKRASRSETV